MRRIAERLAVRCRVLTRAVVDCAGVKVRLGPHLSPPAARALCRGTYEQRERRMVEAALTPDDVVLELGAGIGFISSLCAKRIGSKRVVAYEPNPALRRHILETYRLNGVAPTLETGALGRRAGTATLYVEKRFCSSSMIQRSRRAKPVETPVRRFNDEVRRINPTFLIVDIEGGEYDLLREIDFCGVTKIALEVHERVIGAAGVAFVESALADAGFRMCPELSGSEALFLRRAGPDAAPTP